METQVKSKTAERELTASRLLNAPVELVWEVWTNPEHIKNWWGPNGFTNTIYKMDVKPGGEWELMMHSPDGTNFWNKHTYTEVVKYKKLVHVHGEPKFEMTITFTPQGNKTLVNIVSLFESIEILKKVVEEFGAAEGLQQNVDKLEIYVNNLPAEHELVIMRRFNAPRELVFKAWTEPERLAQWWGAPKGSVIHVSKLELKPGGMFLYSIKNPNGQDIWGKFIYHEITAPEKLVFVNSFSDKDGGTTANPWMPVWPLEIMNTVTLIEYEGKTTLTIKGKPINATTEEIKSFETFRDSMEGGFGGIFEQLEEYLTKN